MDYATIAASALLSVTLSVLVATRIAARQERGKAQQRAQENVAAVVRPYWQDARRVELGVARGTRESGQLNLQDLVLASRVLDHARALPGWRRALVRYRVRRLVGREWADLVEVHEPMHESDSGAMNIFLRAEARRDADGRSPVGLLTTGFELDASARTVRRLRRQLQLLQRCL